MGNSQPTLCINNSSFTIPPNSGTTNCVVGFYPEEPNLFGAIKLEMLQPESCWQYNTTVNYF